jgi:hypothetical protein
MTTTENNKLLAEFMGEKLPYINKEGNFEFVVEGAGKVSSPNEEDLYRFLPYKYDTDWNWLMKVVEKIESLDFVVIHHFYFSKFEVSIKAEHERRFKNIRTSTNKNKIKAVYNACVEFVKWYNENK